MTPSDPIAFFKDKFSSIDALAEEVSYTNGRMEELLYNLKGNLPNEYREQFECVRLQYFPDIDPKTIEGFSLQLSDGKVYQEDKFMLMVNTARQDCYLYPELSCFDPWFDYCINVMLSTGKRYVKFYDTSRPVTVDFELPEGATIDSHYGVGVGENLDVSGIYLRADNYHEVVRFFNCHPPIPKDIEKEILASNRFNLFGLAYNNKTNEVLKLVYYHYPKRAMELPDAYL